MLRWMCGVTRSDTIRNEHNRLNRGSKRVVQENHRKPTEVLPPCDENERGAHVVRRMLDVDIPGERRRGRPSPRWKDAYTRDMK